MAKHEVSRRSNEYQCVDDRLIWNKNSAWIATLKVIKRLNQKSATHFFFSKKIYNGIKGIKYFIWLLLSSSSIVNQLSKFQVSEHMAEAWSSCFRSHWAACLPLSSLSRRRCKLGLQGADEDVTKRNKNLNAIQALLKDAEKRKLVEISVKNWLAQLKYVSFD